MLKPSDELRHRHSVDPSWRESLYWNFADERNEIGGWIYVWLLPNQPLRSHLLVSLYHGTTARRDANQAAMAAPAHALRGDAGSWVYCYHKSFEHLPESDFDDFLLGGLHIRRTRPMHGYELSFEDDLGSSFELECSYVMPPWDYADGINGTPDVVAQNRYHRAWRTTGSVDLPTTKAEIVANGDSDHSWGRRDRSRFGRYNFKMWSLQSPDGTGAMSAVEMGEPGDEKCYGFIHRDGRSSGIVSIEHEARYDTANVPSDAYVRSTDNLGRSVEARMQSMFAGVGSGIMLFGVEGAGTYDVPGLGRCSGIISHFWPSNPVGS